MEVREGVLQLFTFFDDDPAESVSSGEADSVHMGYKLRDLFQRTKATFTVSTAWVLISIVSRCDYYQQICATLVAQYQLQSTLLF